MCGVPHHSAANYIKQLVEAGHKVAICEQVEDPKAAKGVVKREVIQIITPGTVMDHNLLKETENNFIAAVACGEEEYSIVLNDLSTGELKGYQFRETPPHCFRRYRPFMHGKLYCLLRFMKRLPNHSGFVIRSQAPFRMKGKYPIPLRIYSGKMKVRF